MSLGRFDNVDILGENHVKINFIMHKIPFIIPRNDISSQVVCLCVCV